MPHIPIQLRSSRSQSRSIFATGYAAALLFLVLGQSLARSEYACPQWVDPNSNQVELSPGDDITAALGSAKAGTTFLLKDGTYSISSNVWIRANGIVVRSKSGNREKVILDGNRGGMPLQRENFVPEVLSIQGSDITVADLTIRYARDHGIHASAPVDGPSRNLRLRNINVYDCGQQLIKVNSNGRVQQLHWVDDGILECSLVEFRNTSVMHYLEGNDIYYTGGVDIHGGRNWVIRGNTFRNIWRGNKPMEHAVHIWSKSRGSLIENNYFENCWRGIGLGMKNAPWDDLVRRYDDGAGEQPYFDHIGGMVRNNIIYNARGYRLETGIEIMQVKDAEVYHNTVMAEDEPFNSIEYRWPDTRVAIKNNLCSHRILARDGARAELAGNLEGASPDLLINPGQRNFGLKPDATSALGKGVLLEAGKAGVDWTGLIRNTSIDIGAVQFVTPASLLQKNRALQGVAAVANASLQTSASSTRKARNAWLSWDAARFLTDGKRLPLP